MCAAPEVGLVDEPMVAAIDCFEGHLRMLIFSTVKPDLGFTVLVVGTEQGTLFGGDLTCRSSFY